MVILLQLAGAKSFYGQSLFKVANLLISIDQ
jgi:hypothetical protein